MTVIYCFLVFLTAGCLINTTGGGVWIKLSEYPSKTTFCPYQSIRMHCTHSSTLNQPDWIVENNTKQIFRSLNFKNGGLQHHRIVNDTTEVEVLLIDKVLPEFDGLLYCCQYDLYTGPLRSNYLTLNITEVPKVENITLMKISDTATQVSWQHNDPCQQTESFLITITDSDLTEPPLKKKDVPATGQSSLYSTQLPLTLHTGYTVSITAVARGGRMSAVTTTQYLGNTGIVATMAPQTLCVEEPHTCALYGVTGVLLVILIVLGIVLAVCLLRRWRSSREVPLDI